MKPAFAFSMLAFFWLLLISLGIAARPTPDVKVVSYKPTSQKGVMELKNDVSVRLDLDKVSNAIIPANSKLLYGHEDNSRKVEVFPSPITMGTIVRNLDEYSTTVQPLGHSPGIGHGNPPGEKALVP